MSFNDVTAAGQAFSELTDIFGESFSYSNASLIGIFNQVEIEYQFAELSTKQMTGLICVSSKPQWVAANVAPADRGVLTYAGITYQIEKIDGASTPAEPSYTLTLKKLS